MAQLDWSPNHASLFRAYPKTGLAVNCEICDITGAGDLIWCRYSIRGPGMVERIVDASFRMSDELFARIEPLLPKYRKSKKGGRPRTSWRAVLNGIFYVLRTGCQWKALPPEFGSGSTAHAYFQILVKRRTFTKLWKAALEEYDELKGIEWKWQSMDGAMSKAPLGGEKNRPESDGSRQAGYQAIGFDGRQRHPLSGRNRRCQHA